MSPESHSESGSELRPARLEGALSAQELSIGIVVSRWNEFITRELLAGALEALRRHGAEEKRVTVIYVPGSFEIPTALQALAKSGRYDGLVALGCVIRGATTHYDHIAGSVASGIQSVALATGVPIAFGVLTVESIEQAIERAGSKAGNKGAEAAMVAVEMAHLVKQISVGD